MSFFYPPNNAVRLSGVEVLLKFDPIAQTLIHIIHHFTKINDPLITFAIH